MIRRKRLRHPFAAFALAVLANWAAPAHGAWVGHGKVALVDDVNPIPTLKIQSDHLDLVEVREGSTHHFFEVLHGTYSGSGMLLQDLTKTVTVENGEFKLEVPAEGKAVSFKLTEVDPYGKVKTATYGILAVDLRAVAAASADAPPPIDNLEFNRGRRFAVEASLGYVMKLDFTGGPGVLGLAGSTGGKLSWFVDRKFSVDVELQKTMGGSSYWTGFDLTVPWERTDGLLGHATGVFEGSALFASLGIFDHYLAAGFGNYNNSNRDICMHFGMGGEANFRGTPFFVDAKFELSRVSIGWLLFSNVGWGYRF